MTFRIALRNILRHRLRSAVTIAGLSIAIALLADMMMLAGGMDKSFVGILATLGYEIRICPAGTLPFSTEAEIPGSGDIMGAAGAEAGVDRTLRVLGASLFVHPSAGDARPVFTIGLNGDARDVFRVDDGVVVNTRMTWGGAEPVDVMINEPLRSELGLTVGETFHLYRSAAASVGGLDEALLCRVAATGGFYFDLFEQRTLGIGIDVLQSFLGKTNDPASFILAKLDGSGDAFAPTEYQQSVTDRYREMFPHLSVYSIEDLIEHLRAGMAYFQQFSIILGSISVLITFLLVSIVLIIGVNEKRGEIAAMRSIGFRGRTLRRMVFAESVVLIAASTAVGTALGLVLSEYLDQILTASPGIPDTFSFFVPTTGAITKAIVIATLTGLAAAIYPAYHTTRIDIVKTMHEEIL